MTQLANQSCLLCGSTKQSVVDVIPTDIVAENYARSYEVDVATYFQPGGTLSLIECGDCGLRYYDPLSPGDAAFYEALQRLPWYYQDIKPEYYFAKSHVESQHNVLEVGCGKGVFRTFLPDTIGYQGLEFNQIAIEKATRQGLNVTSEPIQIHADLHAGEYDVVCHFQVLEHVTDPLGFLQACAKAVKPGGKLIVAVPAEDSFLSLHRLNWLNMPPHHVSRWKDRTLKHALENELGLSVQSIWHEPVAEYHTDWHRSILINHAIERLLGKGHSEAGGNSLLLRLARRLSKPKFIQDRLLESTKNNCPHATNGHTVCVVAAKV